MTVASDLQSQPGAAHMPEVHQDEFFWVDSNEPHAQRRKAVLAKYGNQVRKLYGYDNRTAYQVRYVSRLHYWSVYHRGCCTPSVHAVAGQDSQRAFLQVSECTLCLAQVMFVMAIQLAMAYYVRNLPWWKVLVVAYTVSGTCNQNLLSAQHEISHFLALKKPFWNKILAVASNCPIVVPVATKFRQYHQEHHSHLVCPNTFLCAVSLSCTCKAGVCSASWRPHSLHINSYNGGIWLSVLYNALVTVLLLRLLVYAAVSDVQGHHRTSVASTLQHAVPILTFWEVCKQCSDLLLPTHTHPGKSSRHSGEAAKIPAKQQAVSTPVSV